MHKRLWLRALMMLLACNAGQASAADLYRYVNEKGITVLGLSVPPQFVSRGYEVLDGDGRVKAIVPAALTPEEREAKRLAESEQARQRGQDATLLRLYANVADLDRAHVRKIQQIDGLIATSKNTLLSLKTQQEELQSRAAAQQRAGRQVDPQVLAALEEIEQERTRLQRRIATNRAEIELVNQDFAKQRARLEQLLVD